MAGRPATQRPRATSIPLPDGRTLVAHVWPGHGIPLVLLPGLLDCGEGWSDLARSLGRSCIAFDLPGFGGSDLVARPRISSYLVLLAPAGFGRIRLAEAVSIPGIRTVVEHALPLAPAHPLVLTAAYMTVVTRRRVPDAETLLLVPPSHVDAVRRALPQARIEVWRDMGHHPQRERPGPLSALIGGACSDTTELRDATRIAA